LITNFFLLPNFFELRFPKPYAPNHSTNLSPVSLEGGRSSAPLSSNVVSEKAFVHLPKFREIYPRKYLRFRKTSMGPFMQVLFLSPSALVNNTFGYSCTPRLVAHTNIFWNYSGAASELFGAIPGFRRKFGHLEAAISPVTSIAVVGALQSISGVPSILRVNAFTRQLLPVAEAARLYSWRGSLLNFQRVFGKNLFLTDSLIAFYIGIRLRDLPMMMTWLKRAFRKMNFWRYRSFLHFIRYLFKHLVVTVFKDLGVKGIRFRLKGKISVAGNARTRTIEHTIGAIGGSTKSLSVLQETSTINTFTGVLGLRIWLCFLSPLNSNE